MKTNKFLLNGLTLLVALVSLIFVASCSDDDDVRSFESARVVGVKMGDQLYTPSASVDAAETIIAVPAGTDLSNVKIQVLVANGELVNFENNAERDWRQAVDLTLKGFDGATVRTKLRVQSAPKLANFIIKGLSIPAADIHESPTSIIVQVPEHTDLTALEVTVEFLNGQLLNFENGIRQDYTLPHDVQVMGVDGETIYPYQLIITTEKVGPASIKGLVVNGIATDSLVTTGGKLVPYIPALIDFTSADVELQVGYGNTIDAAFNGTGMNLMTGSNKVTVTGSDGVPVEFTIGRPRVSKAPRFFKTYTQLQSETGMGGNDLNAVGFSGDHVLACNYTSATKTPLILDLDGNKTGVLSNSGVNATGYGFRKFCTDDKGKVLAMSLGMSSGEQWIYKWDGVSATGSQYISFSKASLGVDYNPRAAGISVMGSLDGNATIVLTIAQKTDAFVWTVTGGTLNPTPQKMSFPYGGASYYWTVTPMPEGTEGFVGFVTNNTLAKAGVVQLSKTMSEVQKVTGFYTTDGATVKYNGRIYLAYVAHSNQKAIMRLCDITDGQLSSYENPIMEYVMKQQAANANATMDACFGFIGGKLYAAYACTNCGLYVYEL